MRHGAAVNVDYVDLQEATAREQHADVLRTVEERQLPYPLVAINGSLKLAGSAEIAHVLPLVEAAMRGLPDPC
jgi:disulfide oxidoreductase YuzD